MKRKNILYQYYGSLWILILMAFIGFTQNAFAQEKDDVSGTVGKLMKEARQGKGVRLKDAIAVERASKEKKIKILREIKKYSKDPSEQVRISAQSLIFEVAKTTDDPEINKEAVTILSQSISDPSKIVSRVAVKLLLKFQNEFFIPNAKSSIVAEFKKGSTPDPELVRLVGVAGIESLKGDLKRIVKEDSISGPGKWYAKTSWAASLALARMGDKSAMDYVLQKVESEEDELLKVGVLLEDVAYIRQPEAVKYIETYLYSEGRFPPLIPGDEGGRYSQFAVYHLADILEHFPLPARYGYNDQEIELAKKWMLSNSNYIIKK